MSYNGKSPAQINIAAMFGGAAKGSLSQDQVAKLERAASRRGFGSRISQQFLDKYRASQASTTPAAAAPQPPSVVATAGASGMSGRIEGIESRLAALEGGGTTAGAVQPAEVAPSETQAQAAASQMTDANQAATDASLIGGFAKPIPPAADQAAAASEQLGSLMASPFTMRQRSNMGPLTFKDQTGDGKITRADVIKARIEGYKK